MLSAFKFRLYPDEETEERLQNALAICCCLYNKSLADRKRRYKETEPPPVAAIVAGESGRGSGKQVLTPQTNLERGDSGIGSPPLQG
jgi:transposase